MNFTLNKIGLVDSPPQPEYDNLTKLASQLVDAPVSLISIVEFENDRQFFKSHLGLPEPWATKQQTPLSHSFCQHVVRENTALVVKNAPEHPLVKNNLAIPDLGVIAYLGVPIYTPDNQPAGALCVIQSEPRQWTEQEIASLKQLAACVSDTIRLKASLLTSEQLRKEQRDFTYAISHDLKSPANTIKMLLSELGLECLSDDSRYLLETGVAITERMTNQVEDILEYTKVIGNEEPYAPVDLNALIEDIATDLAQDIKATNSVLEHSSLPTVFGYRSQLRSLFQNLIGNALKFCASNRPNIVSISANVDSFNRFDEIKVADKGIGIAHENQEKIFDLFTRLHVREDFPGTGIGLSICYRVCSNHNGALSVSSELGVGSVFTVKLPRSPI